MNLILVAWDMNSRLWFRVLSNDRKVFCRASGLTGASQAAAQR